MGCQTSPAALHYDGVVHDCLGVRLIHGLHCRFARYFSSISYFETQKPEI